MELQSNYHECKLEVKAVLPGSLSSFLWAYCKTANCPESLEPAYIRKSISFAKLSAYVRQNLANDFDLWYRKNEDGPELLQVLANIFNEADGRTETYCQPQPTQTLVSEPFYLYGLNLQMVLVHRN